MQKLFKKMIAIAMFLLVISPVLALPAQAVDVWGNNKSNVQAGLGLGNEDPRVIAAKVINVLMGFLGIIAVVIILAGGFKWMTAGGNEDKIGESKKMITAGVIGLVIILAAWGIATFVVDSLLNATGANG